VIEYEVLDWYGLSTIEKNVILNEFAQRGWKLIHVVGSIHYLERDLSVSETEAGRLRRHAEGLEAAARKVK
jgi:hypothetical protein